MGWRQRLETIIGLAAALWGGAARAGILENAILWLDPGHAAVERRLAEITAELASLPPPRRSPGYIHQGFIMTPRLPESDPPWLEITFPEPRMVDTVVLFPRILPGSKEPIEGFGFPKRYRVTATSGDAATRLMIADMTHEDVPNPGVTPVVIPGPRREVTSVRLEVVKSWQDDVMATLAMSEIMLLDGNRNVAVQGRVTASHPQQNSQITEQQVIDMRTPLGLPVVNESSTSFGYQSRAEKKGALPKAVTIDLGEPGTIDEVRLVPVSREGPLSYSSFGFPPMYTVEVSATADFAAARPLTREPPQAQVAPEDNLVVLPGRDGERFRYVRVTATNLWPQWLTFLFALAEVQVYRGDTNVALGCPVEATDSVDEPGWSPAALTDGYAYEKRLVELPDWIARLVRRDRVLAEQALLLEHRGALVARAAARARHGSLGLALGGVVAAAGSALWQRRRFQREANRMREQISRDLHDDIGSNLASIAMISRFLAEHCRRPATDMSAALEDVADIEQLATESTASMRDMVEMLAPRDGGDRGGWVNAIAGMANRALRDARVVVETAIDERAPTPDLATRREIYLVAKEVFSNVAKHAQAADVTLRITADSRHVELAIHDDGVGFEPQRASKGHGLTNLAARAAKLHGTLAVESAPGAGTTVRLRVPHRLQRLPA